MNTTFFKHSKAFLLVLFFIIVSNIYGQDEPCPICNGPTLSQTYPSSVGTFTLVYKQCSDGTVEFINMYCNGATLGGKDLLIHGIANFFRANLNARALKIPAICMRWVKSVGRLAPNGDGMIYDFALVSCDTHNVGCCIFPRSSEGLLQELTTQGSMCGEDCFESCILP